MIFNFEYGKDFSGPGKDVFHLDRVTSDPEQADESNFLHPVLYYFNEMTEKSSEFDKMQPKEQSVYILSKYSKKHHVLEDFLTMWTEQSNHQLHFRRFFESILGINLKRYTKNECLSFHAIFGSYPIMCSLYFK